MLLLFFIVFVSKFYQSRNSYINHLFFQTDDDLMNELKSESKMDIGELKKKISEVIDQECIVSINRLWFYLYF